MEIKTEYSMDRWPGLREPAREVTGAMLRAMRFMDTCKEHVLILEGMPMTAQLIHEQAHTYGEMWDAFGDILHQRHLMQEFPGTPELDEAPDLTRSFEIILLCMEGIEQGLSAFVLAAEGEGLYPLARAAETLQMQNSEAYTKWLEAAHMWEESGKKVSYEKWILSLFRGETGGEM